MKTIYLSDKSGACIRVIAGSNRRYIGRAIRNVRRFPALQRYRPTIDHNVDSMGWAKQMVLWDKHPNEATYVIG